MEYLQAFNEDFANTIEALRAVKLSQFQKAVDLLHQTRLDGSSVWILGNGGSASTASHFANDLWKMCGVKAIALTDLTPTILAYSNDLGWDNMFVEMLNRRFVNHDQDVLIGISCSGNSKNVIEAMKYPNPKIVLTGDDGGELKNCRPDAILYAQHPDIRVQENVHLILCHMIAGALKND